MPTLVANSIHTYKVEPDHVGGREETVRIRPSRVEVTRRTRKKQPPDSLLLIGFDTEFQTDESVDIVQVRKGTASADVEVLSYQISAMKISTDGSVDQIFSKEIILPQPGQRLSLADFAAIAIGRWMRDNPNLTVPSSVILIGHYTKADLPAFNAFTKTARSFANIRNTFVSMKSNIKLSVHDSDENKTATFSLTIRDSILLAPAGAKSLADVGEMLNVKKIRLDPDPEREADLKSNMKKLLSENWNLFRDYAIQDAVIPALFGERCIRKNYELYGDFSLPITLTSFGTNGVLKSWKELCWDENAILGKEVVTDRNFSVRLGYHVKSVKPVFINRVFNRLDFVTGCYHGGRAEQYHFGIAPAGVWRDFDLSSAYTTAMSMIGMPDWSGLKQIDSLDGVCYDDLAFFEVNFEFSKRLQFPVLPVRTEYGLLFPFKGTSTCGAPELLLARDLGAKFTIVEGWIVPTDRSKPIFSPFIKACIEARNKYPKGSFENAFHKEVGNSTYGKTAQGLRKRKVYDLRDDMMVDLPESRLTQPFFAAFITSFSRAVLGAVMNALPITAKIFSATTDGFLTTATEEQMEQATAGPLPQLFRTARQRLVGDDKIFEVKHSVKQPLGWRTRGSATLKPGTSSDEESNYVLQKGGIKTKFTDTPAENDYIVRLFFERTPDQKISYTVPIGIRDMLNCDTDFVFRKQTKALRMEYDWKRKPVRAKQVEVTYKGVKYSQASFDTVPMEDINEFRRYREAWEDYNRKERHCLKTVDQLNRFLEYVETKRLPRSTRAYMSKNNGVMKRLGRDLCRAFKHRQAGFEALELRGKKMKHLEFCSILAKCAIPCDVDMLDYAKRKPFTPYESLATEQSMRAIEKLKAEYFPDLRVDEFFAEEE